MTDPLNTNDDDQVLEWMDGAGKGVVELKGPGTWHNFGKGSGSAAMQGFARVGRAAALAGYAPLSPFLTDRGKEAYFDTVVGATDAAIDYWTPDAGSVGKAGQITNSLITGITPLTLGPAALVGTTALDTGADVTRGGGTTGQAVAASTVAGVAAYAGVKMPAAFGTTFTSRMVSGVGGNVLIDAGSTAAIGKIVEDNKGLAERYQVTPESVAISSVTGAIFAGREHLISRQGKAPGAAAQPFTSAERDAVLTTNNADHFSNRTMPGVPRTRTAAANHQTALAKTIEDILADRPVDVQGVVNPRDFQAPDRPSNGREASFEEKLKILESGGRANAKARTSSATGLHQFTDKTWLATVRNARPAWAQGLNENQLLEMRTDPVKSTEMEQVLRAENSAWLAREGQAASFENLYAMHHFGGNGIKFARASGDTLVTEFLTPAQIRANKYVLHKDGTPRTKAELVENWRKRLADAGIKHEGTGYAAGAPVRFPGETDLGYAQRVLPDMENPQASHLPPEPTRYFDARPDTPRASIDALSRSNQTEALFPERELASRWMAGINDRLFEPLPPVDVIDNGSGGFEVLAGHHAVEAARTIGLSEVPVRVHESRSAYEASRTTTDESPLPPAAVGEAGASRPFAAPERQPIQPEHFVRNERSNTAATDQRSRPIDSADIEPSRVVEWTAGLFDRLDRAHDGSARVSAFGIQLERVKPGEYRVTDSREHGALPEAAKFLGIDGKVLQRGDAEAFMRDVAATAQSARNSNANNVAGPESSLDAVRRIADEAPETLVLDGFDADGNPRYRPLSDALSEVEAERVANEKDAAGLVAAANCFIRRNG